MLWIISFWKKHQFKIAVVCSIVLLIYVCVYHSNKQGSWSLTYDYIPHRFDTKHKPMYQPAEIFKRTPKVQKKSKGERECKRVLEHLFGMEFPTIRPSFLRNSITGRNLELDCSNDYLKLAVEYQGEQHTQYNSFMHRNKEAFWNQQYRDDMTRRLCKENGWTLIEVPHTLEINEIEQYLRDELRAHGYQF